MTKQPAKKGTGVNPAEKYLASLGKKSFLSLWSYPNVYYSPGKEFTDLLVVCGNDILIFQDKWSEFPDLTNIEVAWRRWFKRTVAGGAKQVWGAERLLRDLASPLYLDAACKTAFPIPIPNLTEASFHLIVVTHGGSVACQATMGGSGSFMIHMDLKGLENHVQPFAIGDLDSARTFVHVMDDTTLDILMRTLDTITDFTSYLRKKETFLRGPVALLAAGEEELLANYLKHMNANQEHDFDFGALPAEGISSVAVDEGFWTSFITNPQRLAQIEQDTISYLWDGLIERFNHHALEGTQYPLADSTFTKGVSGMEQIVRFMAKESRFRRRYLSLSLKEMIETTPADQRRIRVLPPSTLKGGLCYVFLLFPLHLKVSYEDYRLVRARFLQGTCLVAKLKFPDAEHIVGIATESGFHNDGRSEDALYLDARKWTAEMQAEAQEFQTQFGVLVKPAEVRINAQEYPEVVSPDEFVRNPRNKPCPCGSGKKYKKCCLPKGRTFYN